MWTDRGWKVSSEKLCWRCEPDLQRSKLRVQQLVWIWSSGEKAGLGVKTWVSTAHRRKEENGAWDSPGRGAEEVPWERTPASQGRAKDGSAPRDKTAPAGGHGPQGWMPEKPSSISPVREK